MADEANKERKMLVETTGDFMLTDASIAPNQDIQAERPSVVRVSSFIEQMIAAKKLKMLEDDYTGTDEEFAEKWEKDEKSANSKSTKAGKSKKSQTMNEQMNKRSGGSADPNRTPDTILDTDKGRETFKERTEGKDADKAK